MDERLRSSGYVRIDETRVPGAEQRQGAERIYIGVRQGRAGRKNQRIILFGYDPSRGGEVADALIEGCSGYLQSDGLSGLRGRE